MRKRAESMTLISIFLCIATFHPCEFPSTVILKVVLNPQGISLGWEATVSPYLRVCIEHNLFSHWLSVLLRNLQWLRSVSLGSLVESTVWRVLLVFFPVIAVANSIWLIVRFSWVGLLNVDRTWLLLFLGAACDISLDRELLKHLFGVFFQTYLPRLNHLEHYWLRRLFLLRTLTCLPKLSTDFGFYIKVVRINDET